MLTTSCPQCEKEVTVPMGARSESRVRCPLCSEEYTLASIFSDLPPLLELLDAPVTNGAAVVDDQPRTTDVEDEKDGGGDGMFDFDGGGSSDDEQAGEGGIGLADPVVEGSPSSGFDFGGDETPAAASVGGATTSARTPRPRKKSASPMKSIIGVIIGGLCAAPIAQFTLWYLPGDWDIEQRDPMGIGRKLDGTFVSFLVPSWVKNPGGDTAVAETPEGDPPTGESNNELANQLPDADDEPSGLGSLLGSGNDPTDNGNTDEPEVDVFDPLAGGNDVPGTGGDDIPGTGGVTDPAPQTESAVKNAPSYTTGELGDELKIVQEEVKRFDDVTNASLDGGARLAIRNDFFAAVGKLAEVTTFTENRPEGFGDFLDEILASAGSTATKRKIIGVSALGIVKNPGRDTDGIILAGTVREIKKSGQLFETVLEVEATDNPPISIYGEQDPRGALDKGDDVMILGVIIDKPKDELRGYKGPPDPVIWGGYSKVIDTNE